MANIINQFGQIKVGFRSPQPIPSSSTVWNNIYSVYNADSVGSSSLKTSLYAAYNGESNANDSFGSNNGTAQGGLTYTAGKIGNAFTFNGTNAYLKLPNNSLNFTSDFSVSFWMKLGSLNQTSHIIDSAGFSDIGTTGWVLNLASGNLRFTIYNNNNASSMAANYVLTSTSVWYHIVITSKSGYNAIYINNSLIISNTSTMRPNYVSSSYNIPYIGVFKTVNTQFFNGNIDGLNFWNKSLTVDEVSELYNSDNGAQYITNDFYKPTTNDALLVNNGTAQGGLTYGVGKVGTAFQFNGTNAYVSLPDNSLNFTGDFSFSLWMNRKAAVQANILTNYYNGATPFGWWLSISNGTLQFRMGNGTSTVLCNLTTALLGANIWQLITITKSSSSVKMYVDGVLKTSATITGNVVYTTTHYPLIGAVKYDTSSPKGFLENNCLVDAVNIWQKELSASEITELYNSGNGIQYTSQLVPLLLDTYSGAAAAYSLRKLRTAYTGNAITVRRSSDNTSQNIGFDANGNLDTSSMLSFVGAGNGFVSVWFDQSGNGRNLIQNTSTNQLRIVLDGVLDTLNGKPSMYNSAGGINKFMKVSFGANLAQPNTYFHLGSHTNLNGYILDNNGGTTQSAIYQGSSNLLRLYAGTDLNLTYTPNISTQRLIFAMTNGTTSRLGVNGATGSTGNANTGFMNGLTLSATVNGTGSIPSHHQEIIVFNSNQLTNRIGIESNINTYYSIY